jgi:hypothetical protein
MEADSIRLFNSTPNSGRGNWDSSSLWPNSASDSAPRSGMNSASDSAPRSGMNSASDSAPRSGMNSASDSAPRSASDSAPRSGMNSAPRSGMNSAPRSGMNSPRDSSMNSGYVYWDSNPITKEWDETARALKALKTAAKEKELLQMITLEDITIKFHLLRDMYGAVVLDDAAGDRECVSHYKKKLEKYVEKVRARMDDMENKDHKRDMQIRISAVNTLLNSLQNM